MCIQQIDNNKTEFRIIFCIFAYMRKLKSTILTTTFCCLLLACGNSERRFDELQKQRLIVEDSIGNGHDAYAFRETDKFMSEAADSTTYYLWLSTRNKAFYTKMMADSMLMAGHRIEAYLKRNEKKDDKATTILRAEWLMSQGVIQTAFMGRPDLGLNYNTKATALIRKHKGNNELLLSALTNTADYYRQMGKLDLSADAYTQALALADSMQDNRNAPVVVELGIATAYSFMADYDNSEYWWKRIETKADSMLYDDQFIFYNNRGNDLYFQHKYKEAMPYFEKAVQLVRGKEQKQWDYYTALANMGENYVCLGQADKGRQALNEADAFFKQVGFDIGAYYTTTSYIKLALLEGKPASAIDIIKRAKQPEPVIPTAIMQRLEAVEKTMCAIGNYREAYATHKRLDNIRDSVQAENARMRMNTNLLRFKHDKQLAQQQHTIDQQHIISLTAWGLCAVSLLAIAVLATLFRLQRKKSQLREMEERQKLVKLRMENARNRISPHFVYNALNHELLAQIKGQKVDLFSLTQLLRRGISQASNLETTLKEEMEFVDYYVGIEGRQMGDDFSYATYIDPAVDMAAVRLPAMVVQIFVENAIKHGLRAMTPREGAQRMLRIRISRSDEQHTMVEVTDNGLGLSVSGKDSTHTGMRIVRQTIQILNDRNKHDITFGIENCSTLEAGHTGCRSWIAIPDDYNYDI